MGEKPERINTTSHRFAERPQAKSNGLGKREAAVYSRCGRSTRYGVNLNDGRCFPVEADKNRPVPGYRQSDMSKKLFGRDGRQARLQDLCRRAEQGGDVGDVDRALHRRSPQIRSSRLLEDDGQ